MGKQISNVGGAASAPVQQAPAKPSSDVGGVAQSPTQSPAQSPMQSQPTKFWPPAFGWRLSALDGERSAHNGWQSRWLQQGSAIAGGGPIDSVAALKPVLRPHLQQGAHRA